MSPAFSLSCLLAGYAERERPELTFACVHTLVSPDFYARAISTPQRPRGILVACSDSRLPDAVIAGQQSGELFV